MRKNPSSLTITAVVLFGIFSVSASSILQLMSDAVKTRGGADSVATNRFLREVVQRTSSRMARSMPSSVRGNMRPSKVRETRLIDGE